MATSQEHHDHTLEWECFQWKWNNGEEPPVTPATSETKKDESRESAAYGEAINFILDGQEELPGAKLAIEKLSAKSTNRERYEALSDLSRIYADILLGLNTLIAAQEKEQVEARVRELTVKWRNHEREEGETSREPVKDYLRLSSYEEPFPDDDRWIGFWPHGGGSFGKTQLYQRQDEHGRVSNRVVVKDCDYDTDDKRYYWNDTTWFWTTDSSNEKVPIEAKTMADLRGKSGSEFIVKLLNWRISEERRLYRLYLEGYNSLWITNDDGEEEGPSIPERFLWYTLECLCIAGLLFERGEMEQNPMSDWDSIVHRDLKLSNVFLGLPSEQSFCRYPVPKIGDFGLAAYLTDGEMFPVEVVGTHGNYPIEHNPDWMPALKMKPADWPMTSKANVWGFANIVASLVIGAEGFDYLGDLRVHHEPTFEQPATDEYSDRLLQLLRNCMSLRPDQRPDLVEVLRIAVGVNALHRDEPADSDNWTHHELDEQAIDVPDQAEKKTANLVNALFAGTVGGKTGAQIPRNKVKSAKNLVNGSLLSRLRPPKPTTHGTRSPSQSSTSSQPPASPQSSSSQQSEAQQQPRRRPQRKRKQDDDSEDDYLPETRAQQQAPNTLAATRSRRVVKKRFSNLPADDQATSDDLDDSDESDYQSAPAAKRARKTKGKGKKKR